LIAAVFGDWAVQTSAVKISPLLPANSFHPGVVAFGGASGTKV
jgi:hypothetical protein